jgi:5-methylcytosine-specific restriction endonuclease McrA
VGEVRKIGKAKGSPPPRVQTSEASAPDSTQAEATAPEGNVITPIRLCVEPRCPSPATARGRCDEHRKALERERSRDRRATAHKRFYDTKRWKLTARHYRFHNPLCEYEVEDGKQCGQIAAHVHHIVDIADGGALYDPENLMAVCKPHHSRITLERLRREG